MRKPALVPELAQAHIELRRARIFDAVRRPLTPAGAGAPPLSAERTDYLCREAEDLFWDELAWEEMMDEERVAGGHLTELVFPAFLAFVDGLLLERVPRDAKLPARPHPDVVEEILRFLGGSYVRFTSELEQGADSERLVWARAMAARLVDLVLYRLYRLTPDELEEIEELD